MGGLRKHMPSTFWTFVIGTAAIAGFPPLAGFFSKDSILAAAAEHGRWDLWAIGMVTAGLTSFYMFRAVYITFFGKFRGTHEQEHHLHESPAVMTVPLWILAVGALFAGFLGVPKLLHETFHFLPEDVFGRFLAPVIARPAGLEAAHHHLSAGLEWLLILLAVAVAVGAWLFSRATYGGEVGLEKGRAWAERFPILHRLLVNKYYVDELYDRAIVRPLAALARGFWKIVDTYVIDGAVNAAAFVTELTGDVARFSTTGNVRNYALYFFLGVVGLIGWVLFG
jgi:NADH-quinone oxidoreductase subunit L